MVCRCKCALPGGAFLFGVSDAAFERPNPKISPNSEPIPSSNQSSKILCLRSIGRAEKAYDEYVL